MSHESNSLQVLVIDDNAVNREVAVELLATHDIVADEAVEGMDGLAKLARKRYDAVLLDISMPGLDGKAVCTIMRKDPLTRSTFIVAYTAHAFSREYDEAAAAGFDAVLAKPISFESLTRALEPMLLAQGCAG